MSMLPADILETATTNLIKMCAETKSTGSVYKELRGKTVSLIVAAEKVRDIFSREEIEKILEDTVIKACSGDKDKVAQVIERELSKLDEELDFQIGDWRFILPILNINISQELRIGKVRLFTFTEENAKEIEDYERKGSLDENEKTDSIKSMRKMFADPLLGKTCAEVVLFGSAMKLHNTALDQISKALSLIKLFGEIDNTFGQNFGFAGDITPIITRNTLRFKQDGQNYAHLIENFGPIFPFHLSPQFLNMMKENGFDRLVSIFDKPAKDDLDTRILTSISWYGKAYDVQTSKRSDGKPVEVEMLRLSDKLVKITIAIESLVIQDGQEPVVNTICERTACLLALNKVKFDEIANFLSKMYRSRSAIVHHGQMSFSKEDVDRFQMYVRDAIVLLIKNKEEWDIKNQDDFFYWLEKERVAFRFGKHS